eukprot:m.64621 g.64621  ORF g.64621 m.64621 type:complete len:406 (-) comp11497_c0_seq2:81-1298(-)
MGQKPSRVESDRPHRRGGSLHNSLDGDGRRRNTFSGVSVFKKKKKKKKVKEKRAELNRSDERNNEGNNTLIDGASVHRSSNLLSPSSTNTRSDAKGNGCNSDLDLVDGGNDEGKPDNNRNTEDAMTAVQLRSKTFSGRASLTAMQSFNFQGLGMKIADKKDDGDNKTKNSNNKLDDKDRIQWKESTVYVSEEDAVIFPQRPSSFYLFETEDAAVDADEPTNESKRSSSSIDMTNHSNGSGHNNGFGFGEDDIDNSNHINIDNSPSSPSSPSLSQTSSGITNYHKQRKNKRSSTSNDMAVVQTPTYLKEINDLVQEATHEVAAPSSTAANQQKRPLVTLREGEVEDIDSFFSKLLGENGADTTNSNTHSQPTDTVRNNSNINSNSVALESALHELDVLSDLFSSEV